MKQMPLLVIPNNPESQHNYRQLKTENIFRWQYDRTAMINIPHGEVLVVINELENEILLVEHFSTFSVSQGNDSETTMVLDTPIQGNYTAFQFFTAHILESQILPKDFKVSSGLNPSKNKQIYFMNKPHHQQRRNLILSTILPESELYNFFMDPEEIMECIAYKEDKQWGFLYYIKNKDGQAHFRFEPIVNYRNEKKLTSTDKGYRDFTYFLRAEALPKAYKIGRGEEPDKRLSQIRGQNHREITRLLLIPDGRMEAVFHSRFRQFLVEGKKEWFEMADQITAFIIKERHKADYISKLYKEYKHESNKSPVYEGTD